MRMQTAAAAIIAAGLGGFPGIASADPMTCNLEVSHHLIDGARRADFRQVI
jgi:hypothetical protein